jgi:hypothetical protein
MTNARVSHLMDGGMYVPTVNVHGKCTMCITRISSMFVTDWDGNYQKIPCYGSVRKRLYVRDIHGFHQAFHLIR